MDASFSAQKPELRRLVPHAQQTRLEFDYVSVSLPSKDSTRLLSIEHDEIGRRPQFQLAAFSLGSPPLYHAVTSFACLEKVVPKIGDTRLLKRLFAEGSNLTQEDFEDLSWETYGDDMPHFFHSNLIQHVLELLGRLQDTFLITFRHHIFPKSASKVYRTSIYIVRFLVAIHLLRTLSSKSFWMCL